MITYNACERCIRIHAGCRVRHIFANVLQCSTVVVGHDGHFCIHQSERAVHYAQRDKISYEYEIKRN